MQAISRGRCFQARYSGPMASVATRRELRQGGKMSARSGVAGAEFKNLIRLETKTLKTPSATHHS